MKNTIIILVILFTLVGCSNDILIEGEQELEVSDEVSQTPQEPIDEPEPEVIVEQEPVDEVSTQPEDSAEPEAVVEDSSEETDIEEINEETDKEIEENVDYDELCDIKIPSDAKIVEEPYGSSHIKYYETVDGAFIGPYWKWSDITKKQPISFRCYDDAADKTAIAADWDSDGNLEVEYYMLEDRYHGLYRAWNDGVLIEELTYDMGVKDGEWTFWSDEGTIEEVENYVDGERDGVWKSYYDNGNLKEEIEYDMGIKTPNVKTYYYDGSLQSQRSGTLSYNKFSGTYTTWEEPAEDGSQTGSRCTLLSGVQQSCEDVTK